MPDIRNPRFARLFGRLFASDGGVQTVLQDVMPTFDLVDPVAELRWSQGEQLFGVFQNVAAGGAGQYGFVSVGPQAGWLAVVELVQVSKAAAGAVFARGTVGQAGGNAFPTGIVGDGRMLPAASLEAATGMASTTGTGGVAPSQGMQGSAAAAGAWSTLPIHPEGIVLVPGTALTITDATANENFSVQVWGFTRPFDVTVEGR